MAFIEDGKVFDIVLTSAGLEALKDQGIEKTYVRLLEDVSKEYTGRIALHKQIDKSSMRKGLIQGDTFALKIFAACLEGFFRKFDCENKGLRINGDT